MTERTDDKRQTTTVP